MMPAFLYLHPTFDRLLTLPQGGIFYHRTPGGLASLPELIFPKRNCAVGMKLCIYDNYQEFFVSIKTFAWFSCLCQQK